MSVKRQVARLQFRDGFPFILTSCWTYWCILVKHYQKHTSMRLSWMGFLRGLIILWYRRTSTLPSRLLSCKGHLSSMKISTTNERAVILVTQRWQSKCWPRSVNHSKHRTPGVLSNNFISTAGLQCLRCAKTNHCSWTCWYKSKAFFWKC